MMASGFFSCSRYANIPKVSDHKEKSFTAAPNFALKDATGKLVKLSDFRGQVVLLDFWATWCSPCKIEIPWFIEFQQAYKDRNFTVLGVSMDDDGWDSVKPFIAKAQLNYRVMIGTDQVSAQYGGLDSLPTTLLIDREGRIAKTHVGLPSASVELSKRMYKSEILNLLDADDKDAVNISLR